MNEKYLVANIGSNTILACSLVEEMDVKDAIRQLLKLAGEEDFDIEGFFWNGCAGNVMSLRNGTRIQVLYTPFA
jgi:hypothetical protein